MRLQTATYSPEPSGPHFWYIARSHLTSSCVSGGWFALRSKQKSFVRAGALSVVFLARLSRFKRISSICSFANLSWKRNEPSGRERSSPELASSCSPRWRLGSILRTSLGISICLRKHPTFPHYLDTIRAAIGCDFFQFYRARHFAALLQSGPVLESLSAQFPRLISRLSEE